MADKCTVETASRQVFFERILLSLRDENKVALLLTEEDLMVLVNCLEGDGGKTPKEFAQDLRQLQKEAYGR